MTSSYRWSGGEEAILSLGLEHPVRLLIIQPLFEEANRTRHMIVSAMRCLAARGIGTALPDLPGTGESLTNLDQIRLAEWRAAALAASTAVGATASVAFRGGCLIDDVTALTFGWRLSPEPGARIARDLERASIEAVDANRVRVAGNVIQTALLDDLKAATPLQNTRFRTVRLSTEAADADVKISGTPLWRRAEPSDDEILLNAIVDDISAWASTCVAR